MWVLFAVLSAAASATLASPLRASEMQTRGRAAAEVDAEEGEELEVQSESPLLFGACPFEVRWEVLQLHHTKMTALAHVSDTSKVCAIASNLSLPAPVTHACLCVPPRVL